MRTYLAVRGWGAIELSSKGPQSHGWMTRHPLITAVVIIVALVWAGSALGITSNADPDDGKRSERNAAHRQEKPERTYLVTHVVDGDTVDLGNGETVRLVGIDTPEMGECGYERATEALTNLVGGRLVTLGESDEDRDQYDRLLRYVDRGAVDAGLTMIESGLAIARYDSRDGYGRHPREDRYIEADRRSPDVGCAPSPKTFVDPPSNCEPGYSPCVPTYPPDLDCADTGPVSVTGSDPHGLDGDGDGVACGSD
jgi:endonuclease YncB( thermonuclease family)